nr:phospho-N-acetylmuramoyl-pentapeptide-transferase [Clostridia bacterium]
MKTELVYFILILAATFIITAVSARILIPKLKSHKMGQKILDVGPRWHKSKEGTPTMGGLSFLIATVIVFIAAVIAVIIRGESINLTKLIITFAMVLLNCMIGIIDDYTKFIRKQNEGLKASQKYLMQLIVSAAYLFAMTTAGCISTAMYIPFVGITLELGWFYYIAAFIVITGIINCVNLTDGIDGLASTVTLVVGAFFAVVAFTGGLLAEVIMSALLIGSCLGFLVYNFYPAKIFMGDTGSLFLGAMVTGLA